MNEKIIGKKLIIIQNEKLMSQNEIVPERTLLRSETLKKQVLRNSISQMFEKKPSTENESTNSKKLKKISISPFEETKVIQVMATDSTLQNHDFSQIIEQELELSKKDSLSFQYSLGSGFCSPKIKKRKKTVGFEGDRENTESRECEITSMRVKGANNGGSIERKEEMSEIMENEVNEREKAVIENENTLERAQEGESEIGREMETQRSLLYGKSGHREDDRTGCNHLSINRGLQEYLEMRENENILPGGESLLIKKILKGTKTQEVDDIEPPYSCSDKCIHLLIHEFLSIYLLVFLVIDVIFLVVLRLHSNFRIRWNIFILILVLYTTINVPLEVAFNIVTFRFLNYIYFKGYRKYLLYLFCIWSFFGSSFHY